MKRLHRTSVAAIAASISIFLLLCFWLHWIWIRDNKYTAGPPYGENGILVCTAQDLEKPLFLIDGWEFYPGATYTPDDFKKGNLPDPMHLFIGQISNFSYIENNKSSGKSPSPFGAATYHLKVVLKDGPLPVSMEIPEIFTDYQIWLNGNPITSTGKSSQADIIVDNELDIIINVDNTSHYYSGLYYPPAIGVPSALASRSFCRTLYYAFLCISTLTLTLYCGILWVIRKKEPLFFHFGMLCLFFCISCVHPFIWQMELASPLTYALEDTARIAMLAEAIWIGSLISGLNKKIPIARVMKIILPTACILCLLCVSFLIPALGRQDHPISNSVISFYGTFIDLFYWAGWLWLCICAAWGIWKNQAGSWFILTGGCCLGAGFLSNLLNNNRFEPILGGWQTEYTGYMMVLVFAVLMVRKNGEILEKNRQLMSHMEDLVTERTQELHAVLEERKNFFSDMAHNLKAPIAAVHGFITLIREENLYLDDELLNYIHLIEDENDEIYQRVQSLSTLNAFDRIVAPAESISVNLLLDKVKESNEPDAGVMGIHFLTGKLESDDISIHGQKEKLLILFENLIYNAITFTPEGGTIQVTPLVTTETGPLVPSSKNQVIIRVSDTGCGISQEHLPHIFERFYVGREDKSQGSGLGLYICKMIVEEMGGSIGVESIVNKGTTFEIRLPIE